MNYELAKKLKDAGFPQVIGVFCFNDKGQYCNPTEQVWECTEPTLSELIEACGDNDVIVLTIGKAYTTALSGKTGIITQDKTPEGAVANLWLALNKK